MGAEALGRGAQVVVGIEQSKAACRIVTDNWRRIAPPDCTVQVIRGDVRRVINQAAKSYPPFDRIYFDPPYASDLYLPVLVQVEALCLLDLSGQMAAEHSPHLKLPDRIAGLLAVDRRVYGQTALTFYERES
jgi:16S rRNA (guanine(966)-N(2))-methyltransferase RsmD